MVLSRRYMFSVARSTRFDGEGYGLGEIWRCDDAEVLAGRGDDEV